MNLTHGTKKEILFRLADSNIGWKDAYAQLRPLVLDQVRPWVFSQNVNGRRIPYPMNRQLVLLKDDIRRKYAEKGREVGGDVREDHIPEPEPIPESEPEPEEEKEIRPVASGKERIKNEQRFFVEEWRRIRRWIKERATSTNSAPIDSLESMRPVEAALHAIALGIPARAMIHSMTLHWSPDTRQQASIESFDVASISPPVEGEDSFGRKFHRMLSYTLTLAEANRKSGGKLPIMFIGAAGTGKTTLAEQLAEKMNLPFAATPLTAGATPSWLLGRYVLEMGIDLEVKKAEILTNLVGIGGMDKDDAEKMISTFFTEVADGKTEAGGYKPSHFIEIYSRGGIHLFGEVDAADPNMLLVMNNALSQNEYFNPVNGEKYAKHEEFIPVADANTFGLGANTQYTGRERLDLATIDRFRMGRIVLELDESIVDNMLANAPR